jgi:hypothetical protein
MWEAPADPAAKQSPRERNTSAWSDTAIAVTFPLRRPERGFFEKALSGKVRPPGLA